MSGGGFGSVPAFPPVDDFFVGVLGEDPAAVPDIFEGRKRGEPRKLKIVCIGAGWVERWFVGIQGD